MGRVVPLPVRDDVLDLSVWILEDALLVLGSGEGFSVEDSVRVVVATGEGFSVVDSVGVVVSGTPGSLAPTVVVSVGCAGTPNVTVRVVTLTVEVDSPWIE